MNPRNWIVAATTAALIGTAASAQDVRITTFQDAVTFTLNGQTYTIARTQDPAATLTGDFARTARACPPDCLQPMTAAEGVATVGELELLSFLENAVSDGDGLLIDARMPDDHTTGAIPGAVNVPHMTLAADNRYRDDILQALGAVPGDDSALDFSNAMSLMIFSGGVWSGDAPTAIDHLVAAGYPPGKLFYYRGGMQAWVQVGLTVQAAQTPG